MKLTSEGLWLMSFPWHIRPPLTGPVLPAPGPRVCCSESGCSHGQETKHNAGKRLPPFGVKGCAVHGALLSSRLSRSTSKCSMPRQWLWWKLPAVSQPPRGASVEQFLGTGGRELRHSFAICNITLATGSLELRVGEDSIVLFMVDGATSHTVMMSSGLW